MAKIEWKRKAGNIVFWGGSGQIIKGEFHATVAGSGMALTTARTWIERGNADDGGAILTGSGAAYLFGSRRLLVTAAQTGNNSWYGGCDRLSVNADISGVSAHVAGHWGFLEMKAGCSVNYGAAVRGQVDMPATAVAAGVVSCFMAASNTLAGTHTGQVVALHVTNPVAGTFDGLARIGSATDATGCVSAGGTKTSHATVSKFIKVYIADVLHYIPAYDAAAD